MGKKIDLKEKFRDYFDEREGFSLRSERFYDVLSNIVNNPLMTPSMRMRKMVTWMEAAYIEGARAMSQDTLETLGDYGTAVSGINDVVYTRSDAFDTAAINLSAYYDYIFNESP